MTTPPATQFKSLSPTTISEEHSVHKCRSKTRYTQSPDQESSDEIRYSADSENNFAELDSSSEEERTVSHVDDLERGRNYHG